jgi:hypothetical protein
MRAKSRTAHKKHCFIKKHTLNCLNWTKKVRPIKMHNLLENHALMRQTNDKETQYVAIIWRIFRHGVTDFIGEWRCGGGFAS